MFCVLSTAEGNGVQENGVGTGGDSDSRAGKASRQVKGFSLVIKQFHALLVKRFHHATRSSKDFLAQVSPECSTQPRPPVSLSHAQLSHSDTPTCLTQTLGIIRLFLFSSFLINRVCV